VGKLKEVCEKTLEKQKPNKLCGFESASELYRPSEGNSRTSAEYKTTLHSGADVAPIPNPATQILSSSF
jgi:hypothetical protein